VNVVFVFFGWKNKGRDGRQIPIRVFRVGLLKLGCARRKNRGAGRNGLITLPIKHIIHLDALEKKTKTQ